MHWHVGIDSIADSNWHRSNTFIFFQTHVSPLSFYLWMLRDHTFLQPFFTWDLKRDFFFQRRKAILRSLRPILGHSYRKERAREKAEREKGGIRGYEEENRKQISRCTKIHREREFKAHVNAFIKKKKVSSTGGLFLLGVLFQGSEAKRELKCFHSSEISSLLVWVDVSCSAKEHIMKKSTHDCLVNRLSFSPCPRETP